MDPISAAILIGLTTAAIGKTAGWLGKSVARWTADMGKAELLARTVFERTSLSIDSTTIMAFLSSDELEESIIQGSAPELFSTCAAHYALSADDCTQVSAIILTILITSDRDLGDLVRHAEVVDRLASLELGIGFMFGEVLEAVLAARNFETEATSELKLESMLHQLSERVVVQLESLGVEHELAKRLERSTDIGASVDSPVGTAVRVTGRMGSGKSLAAIRWTQVALVRRLFDQTSPIPILLRARELNGADLAAVIEARTSDLGQVRSSGVQVALDGLDEVLPAEANRLTLEAVEIARSWPNSSAGMFARPHTLDAHAMLVDAEIPSLTTTDVNSLGEMFGVRWLASDLPDSVRSACELPLFALLVAVWRQGSQDRVESRAELFERLLRDRVPDPSTSTELNKLAARTLGSAGVTASTLDHGSLHRARLTGLISTTNGIVEFTLPIVEQWYAAHALLDGDQSLRDALATRDTAVAWRYPIALAVALASNDEADVMVAALVAAAPHIVPWVLEQAEERWTRSKDRVPTDGSFDQRVQMAGETLVSKLLVDQGLIELLASTEHEVLSTSITANGWVERSLNWRDKATGTEFPGPRMGMTVDGRDKLAPWTGWLRLIGDQVESLLNPIALPSTNDTYLEELSWAFARVVHASTSALHDPLPIDRPLAEAKRLDHGDGFRVVLHGAGRGQLLIPNRVIPNLIRHLEHVADSGDMIRSPWPAADNRKASSGWIDSLWKPNTMCEMFRGVTESALAIYADLSSSWFPDLSTAMPTMLSLPVEVVLHLDERQVAARPNENLPGRMLTWTTYWLPLEPGTDSRVVVVPDEIDTDVEEQLKRLGEQWVNRRGSDAAWCRSSLTHMVTPRLLHGDRPATSLAVTWLHEDLHNMQFVSNRPHDPY